MIQALYWIGKAKAHEGKIDEAKKITADTIKKYIGNPQREAVEMLLTQLAQLCVKKKATARKAHPHRVAKRSRAELDNLLGDSEQDHSPTAKARILFAKAELARLRRQPAEEEKNIAHHRARNQAGRSQPGAARAGRRLLVRQRQARSGAQILSALDGRISRRATTSISPTTGSAKSRCRKTICRKRCVISPMARTRSPRRKS